MDQSQLIKKRRQATPQERMTPCVFCEYPISERHHFLPIEVFGSNEHTVQLCANCHELAHIVVDALIWKRAGALVLFERFAETFGDDDERLNRAIHVLKMSQAIAGGGNE